MNSLHSVENCCILVPKMVPSYEETDDDFFVGKSILKNRFWTFFLSIFENPKYFMAKNLFCDHN